MLVNLTPARLDLRLYAGDATAVVVRVIDKVTKQPLDLTDRTWSAQWRRKRPSETAVILTVDDTGAATGELIVHFPGTLPALGVWDLQGLHATDGIDTVLTGSVAVGLDVTRTP